MMRLAAVSCMAALLGAGCGGGAELDGTSVVLVHEAWNGAWAWTAVQQGLEDRGARVVTVELPGHGDDMTSVADISLRSYVDAVEAAIDLAPRPVVLVGHSI